MEAEEPQRDSVPIGRAGDLAAVDEELQPHRLPAAPTATLADDRVRLRAEPDGPRPFPVTQEAILPGLRPGDGRVAVARDPEVVVRRAGPGRLVAAAQAEAVVAVSSE